MKKVLLAGLVLVGLTAGARADHDDGPGPNWISIPQVAQRLNAMGFTQISKIEADDGLWEAKGYRRGVYTKVKLDPYSGRIVKMHREHGDDDD